MKRLLRTDAGIDYVKLLSEHAERRGIAAYDDEAIQEFGDDLQRSLNLSARSEPRLRGLRAEALFRTVVAAIGKAQLIKAEDCGDVFYNGEELLVPDYRIVTASGDQWLVEVKAVRGSAFSGTLSLSHTYIEKIRRYAEKMPGAQLRFAIFWEGTRWWTVNRLEAFSPGQAHQRQWRISFAKAFATNEMVELGDYSIQTWAPLRVRVVFDPEKSDPIQPEQEGSFRLAVKRLQMLSQDRELSGIEAKFAWRLIWYGTWQEMEEERSFEGEHMAWVDFPIVPSGWGDPGYPAESPAHVGFLSEMISKAYLQGAARTIHTTAKGGVLQPGYMANFIPDDWFDTTRNLPLVIARMQPNFEFTEDADASDDMGGSGTA